MSVTGSSHRSVAYLFDEDDLEYNRAIFVQLKLEDKLEHEFD